VSTRFPFGLFSKSRAFEAPDHALVYPAVDPVPIPRDFGGARESGEVVTGPRGTGAEVGGVREFERGDAPRWIAWRASLRSQSLWVREVESEHQGEVEVRLRTAGRPADPGFERDVRGSASEVSALLERGLRVGLRTDRDRFDADAGAQQRARLLGFLARVAPDAQGGRRESGDAQRRHPGGSQSRGMTPRMLGEAEHLVTESERRPEPERERAASAKARHRAAAR
jgi:uncharacterized protein (DUF58 family)